MCVSLFAKPRVDNQGSWKEMESWKKSLRGAVGTADSIYLQQQDQNALFANVDASAVGCKGFSCSAYVGMMRVRSAINDISCCIITMQSHCLQTL